MSDEEFCEECKVHVSLHAGPDTCDVAEAKAVLIETFEGVLRP